MAIYIGSYALMGIVGIIIPKIIINKKMQRVFFAWFGGILLFLLFAFRHQSMGIDLGYKKDIGYLASFDKISTFSWKQTWNVKVYHYERGYIIFNKVVSAVWNNRQFFLAVVAGVSIYPIAFVFYKKAQEPLFSWCIYMGLPALLILFSGLRQGIAIGWCFFSILFIQERKPIKFFITVLLCSSFHSSAIIFLIAYPLYHMKTNKDWYILGLCILPIIFIFRYQLFSVLSKIFKEEAIPNDTCALGLMLVFVGIYIFCFLFGKKSKEFNGLLNLFYIACVCQLFAGIYNTAMRVGYYFTLPLTLVIPRAVENMQWNFKEKAMIKILINFAFVLFGLNSLYSSGWACAYPYSFFWQ